MPTNRGAESEAANVVTTLEGQAREIASLLKALSHPARLLLAATLVQGEYAVGELEQRLDIHQPSLSQQLGVLRAAGLVETRREAQQVFYRLTEERVALLLEALSVIFPKT